jgi:hypothetical protein
MPEYANPVPPNLVLSATRGCNTTLVIERRDDSGDPENFPNGSAAFVNVDIDPAVQVEAVIDGATATFIMF